MAVDTDIANAALDKLGIGGITAMDEDSVPARACLRVYARLRRAELRKHVWNFARTQVQLPADSDVPLFDFNYQYQLPPDWLRMLPPHVAVNSTTFDWQIMGRKILSNDVAPLNLNYVRDVTDVNTMDDLFRDALAARMAQEMCEELTQSNTKQELAKAAYKDAMSEAKKINAFENVSAEAPEDEWVTVRA